MKNNAKLVNLRFYSLIFMQIFIMLSFSLSGCSSSSQELTPTPDLNTQYTQAAQTVIAEITNLAESVTQFPSSTPSPTTIFLPTDTPTITNTTTPAYTQTPTPSAGIPELADYRMIFTDDFSNKNGWYTDNGPDYGFQYTETGYLIYVNILAATIWTIKDIELVDSRVEAIGEQISGPDNGYYGVSCRHQDGDNYYALVISNDGRFAIIRYYLGESEFIYEGTAPAGTIYPDQPNKITADCIGNYLTLYANNTQLVSIIDDTISSGVFGLVAGTRNTEGIEAEFFEMNVLAP